jgi:hypothetical protein
MSTASRQRLATIVRRPGVDLAELALLVCAEADPSLDVGRGAAPPRRARRPAALSGVRVGDPDTDATALARYLADEQGFHGADELTPAAALLTDVLDRKRGSPVSLAVLYVAIARRLRVPAFPIGLPGRVVVGIGGGERPVVLDPSRGGRRSTRRTSPSRSRGRPPAS